jgi:hypothetical protein
MEKKFDFHQIQKQAIARFRNWRFLTQENPEKYRIKMHRQQDRLIFTLEAFDIGTTFVQNPFWGSVKRSNLCYDWTIIEESPMYVV